MNMTDAELAFRTGELFNKKITAAFWDSFKGEYGHTQVEVLNYLRDHEQAKAAELAAALGVPKQHISKIVKGFAAEGLLIVSPDTEDQRISLLALSPAGEALLQKHYRISDAHFEQLLNTLPPAQVQELRTAMEQMRTILEIL